MAVTGDFTRLAMLRQRLQRLAKGEWQKPALLAIANEVHRQVIDEFRLKRDPYGRPWAPRKDKNSSWPLLDKTGALINRTVAGTFRGGVRITLLSYAQFLQSGTRKMVARKLVPDGRDLGPIWTQGLLRATDGLGQKLLGGGR